MKEALKVLLLAAVTAAVTSGATGIVNYYLVDQRLEEERFQNNLRLNSAAIAELIAIHRTLPRKCDRTSDSPCAEKYRRAEQLSFELFLRLPAPIYKSLTQGIIELDQRQDVHISLDQTMKDVREWIRDDATKDLIDKDKTISAGEDIFYYKGNTRECLDTQTSDKGPTCN